MDKKEILQKAYLGEAIPGLIHNMGNPLGALLGFVNIMREEVTWLRHDLETFSEEGLREKVSESLSKIAELFDFAARSEQSLRKAMEKMVLKCGKDMDAAEVDFDLNELVKIETDVLMTNAFFKHKISKKFEYGAGPYIVNARWSNFSQPIASMLFRYTVALGTVQNPKLSIRTISSGNKVVIEIRANTILRAEDLVPSGNIYLPALTVQECKDALASAGTVEYAAIDAGNSAVTFDIVLQDAAHDSEKKNNGAQLIPGLNASSRSASTAVNL